MAWYQPSRVLVSSFSRKKVARYRPSRGTKRPVIVLLEEESGLVSSFSGPGIVLLEEENGLASSSSGPGIVLFEAWYHPSRGRKWPGIVHRGAWYRPSREFLRIRLRSGRELGESPRPHIQAELNAGRQSPSLPFDEAKMRTKSKSSEHARDSLLRGRQFLCQPPPFRNRSFSSAAHRSEVLRWITAAAHWRISRSVLKLPSSEEKIDSSEIDLRPGFRL